MKMKLILCRENVAKWAQSHTQIITITPIIRTISMVLMIMATRTIITLIVPKIQYHHQSAIKSLIYLVGVNSVVLPCFVSFMLFSLPFFTHLDLLLLPTLTSKYFFLQKNVLIKQITEDRHLATFKTTGRTTDTGKDIIINPLHRHRISALLSF